MPISLRSIAGVSSSKQINLLMTKYMMHKKIEHIRKINNEISESQSNITFFTSQTTFAHVHVCFVLLSPFVCIFAYVLVCFKTICGMYNQIDIHRSKVHCGSAFEPGSSVLPYYCIPSVCVPVVLGALAVWRLSTKKKSLTQVSSMESTTRFYLDI